MLYASGEESERQIKLRARRLGAENPAIHLFAETDVRRILEAAEAMRPALLLVDSIQTLFDPEFESAAGSVSQVRGCATLLARWAKSTGTPLVLVGHVTKDGTLAGPKVLEHLVDTVLAFEGDRHHHHRLLRALKNRFGAAFELGVFAMTERGLVPVDGNPFFLDAEPSPGCAATVVLSGTRPVVVEIQALVGFRGPGHPAAHRPGHRRPAPGHALRRGRAARRHPAARPGRLPERGRAAWKWRIRPRTWR